MIGLLISLLVSAQAHALDCGQKSNDTLLVLQEENLNKFGVRYYGDKGDTKKCVHEIGWGSPVKPNETPKEYFQRTGERMSVRDYEYLLSMKPVINVE